MGFSWPWALATLLVVPLLFAFWWWTRRRRRRSVVRVTSIALVRAAVPGGARWKRRIPAALLAAGLVLLAVAAAGPLASVAVPSRSSTVLLALDVSGSMCATDVRPNRILAAEEAAAEFVRSQAGGPRIGLVTFSGTAGLLVPPTDDTQSLLDALDGLTTSRGTAIGQGILTALDAIAEIDPAVAPTGADPGSAQARADDYAAAAIVLLTDGANTQGVRPLVAAEQAADRGVRIFTIGFGTVSPAPRVCSGAQIGDRFGGSGGFSGQGNLRGFDGGRNPLTIDEDTLRQIADATGGAYYRAENADQLGDALDDLPSSFALLHRKQDIAAWFAGAGGLLVAAALALSLWWNRVRPQPARAGRDEPVAGGPPARR